MSSALNGAPGWPVFLPLEESRAGPTTPIADDGTSARLVARQDLPSLRPAWRALAERAIEPNAYYEYAFLKAAIRYLEQARGTRILTAWRPGPSGPELVGLLPVRLTRWRWGLPIRIAAALTHDWGPLGTPLLDPDHAVPAASALIRALREEPFGARMALLPFLPRDGAAATAIRAALAAQDLRLTVHGAHRRACVEAGARPMLAGLPTRRRKELSRQQRRLADLGPVRFEVEVQDGTEALADFLALEQAGWKGRRGSAALSRPTDHAFLHAAVTAMLADGRARLHRLRLKDRTIAAGISFWSGRRGWYWKTAFDETLARLSPGVQLTLAVTDDLLGPAGLASLDSSAIPDHSMIDPLWAGRLAMEDWLIDLRRGGSPLGRLAARLERLRRGGEARLRRAVHRLRERG